MTTALAKLLLICIALNTLPLEAKDNRTLRKTKKEIVALSDHDQKILENGEISPFQHAAGALLAIVPGFGLGHAVQGRYVYTGMFFTLAEAGSLAILVGPTGDAGLGLGLISLFGFKVWEIIDAMAGPFYDNDRFRELEQLASVPRVIPFRVAPMPLLRKNDSGKQSTHVGLAFTWNIP